MLRCQLPHGQTLAAGMDLARLKLAYLNRVTRDNLPVFDEPISIFSDNSALEVERSENVALLAVSYGSWRVRAGQNKLLTFVR